MLIRTSSDIKGIEVAGHHYKLNLFADDALLVLTQPLTSLPNMWKLLNSFGDISGLKVNNAKSKALNISLGLDMRKELQKHFQFKWEQSKLKYLGMYLTHSWDTMYAANYPLLKHLNTLLTTWRQYPISWFGRIAAVKMTWLPKLLYYFRVLSIPVPSHILRSCQRRRNAFVWADSRPRIAACVLYSPRLAGGQGLPNVQRYFQAAQLALLPKYHADREVP